MSGISEGIGAVSAAPAIIAASILLLSLSAVVGLLFIARRIFIAQGRATQCTGLPDLLACRTWSDTLEAVSASAPLINVAEEIIEIGQGLKELAYGATAHPTLVRRDLVRGAVSLLRSSADRLGEIVDAV